MTEQHTPVGSGETLEWDNENRRLAMERERLRQRAIQYAQPVINSDELMRDARPLLTFTLDNERYGLDVALVHGVRSIQQIVPVPGVPDYYPGVINVRGQVITTFDLRRFLGLTLRQPEVPPGEAILVRSHQLTLGLLAHRVDGVVNVPATAIKSVGTLTYAHGVTEDHLTVLNLTQLFEDERLIVGADE
ncbi:MAG: chemotaxis protein CheW [Anaerolineae bacterium]|nr:chemotaxis protein CheW [Anaerolineae bacterium]